MNNPVKITRGIGRPMPQGVNPFERISPDQTRVILAIAERAVQLARQFRITKPKDKTIEASPDILQIDIAVVHLHRELRLHKFLQADVLTFFGEIAAIQQHINRPLRFFPQDVMLRFASKGARINL
jgi:hypothetical protein